MDFAKEARLFEAFPWDRKKPQGFVLVVPRGNLFDVMVSPDEHLNNAHILDESLSKKRAEEIAKSWSQRWHYEVKELSTRREV